MSIVFSLWINISGFTILTGPNEARLPVSYEHPEIVFYWDGTTPKIKDKDGFAGGRYSNLEDEEFMSTLLNAAFDLWNDVRGSYLKMSIERKDEVEMDPTDKLNGISVLNVKNFSIAAYAQPTLNDDQSIIDDCDIRIGNSEISAEDLAYTIAHEIGHCVGLGHEHINQNAMMGYTRTSRKLTLGADDRAGIIYLYKDPSYAHKTTEDISCSTIGSNESTTKDSFTSFWALVFFLIPLIGIILI